VITAGCGCMRALRGVLVLGACLRGVLVLGACLRGVLVLGAATPSGSWRELTALGG